MSTMLDLLDKAAEAARRVDDLREQLEAAETAFDEALLAVEEERASRLPSLADSPGFRRVRHEMSHPRPLIPAAPPLTSRRPAAPAPARRPRTPRPTPADDGVKTPAMAGRVALVAILEGGPMTLAEIGEELARRNPGEDPVAMRKRASVTLSMNKGVFGKDGAGGWRLLGKKPAAAKQPAQTTTKARTAVKLSGGKVREAFESGPLTFKELALQLEDVYPKLSEKDLLAALEEHLQANPETYRQIDGSDCWTLV